MGTQFMNFKEIKTRILGVSLLKNEDYFSEWALRNVLPFCDEYLVLDNCSTDQTRAYLDKISNDFSHMKIIDVDDAFATHKYVEEYADTPTWVFGVDGDEIYDPLQLESLCDDLRSGRYDQWWRLDGQALHVVRVLAEGKMAKGFLGPIAKLYNFNAIYSWREQRQERLHGTNIVFKEGYSKASVCKEFTDTNWDNARLRCLHLCFMPRSSNEQEADFQNFAGRPNPAEIVKSSFFRNRVRRIFRRSKPAYKQVRYAVGPLVEVSASNFGAPANSAASMILDREIIDIQAML